MVGGGGGGVGLKLDVQGQGGGRILEVDGQGGWEVLKIGQFSWTSYLYHLLFHGLFLFQKESTSLVRNST